MSFQTSDPIWSIVQTILIMFGLMLVARFFYVMGKYQVFSDDPVCVSRKCPNLQRGLTEAQSDWLKIRELLRKVMKK